MIFLKGMFRLSILIPLICTFLPVAAVDQQEQDKNTLNNNSQTGLKNIKTLPVLVNEVSSFYSIDSDQKGRLHVQLMEFIGMDPRPYSFGFIYPERAALLESNKIRNLYNYMLDSRVLKSIDEKDEYIYKSSF